VGVAVILMYSLFGGERHRASRAPDRL
jgi:hypothetical protein